MLKLLLFVVLGVLIHLGFKFKKAFAREDFEASLFLRKNLVGSILGLVTGLTIVLLRDDIFAMFGLLINNFTSVFIGYTGDSMWKQLIKKSKGKFK